MFKGNYVFIVPVIVMPTILQEKVWLKQKLLQLWLGGSLIVGLL